MCFKKLSYESLRNLKWEYSLNFELFFLGNQIFMGESIAVVSAFFRNLLYTLLYKLHSNIWQFEILKYIFLFFIYKIFIKTYKVIKMCSDRKY